MKLKYVVMLLLMVVLYVATYPPAHSSMLLQRDQVSALENELEIMREAYQSECARSRILGDQLLKCQDRTK